MDFSSDSSPVFGSSFFPDKILKYLERGCNASTTIYDVTTGDNCDPPNIAGLLAPRVARADLTAAAATRSQAHYYPFLHETDSWWLVCWLCFVITQGRIKKRD